MDADRLRALEELLGRALATWATGSVVVGTACAIVGAVGRRRQLLRFGRQTAMWGAVDGAIAVAAARGRRKEVADPDAHARKLQRILWANTVADVAYLAAGAHLVAHARDDRLILRMGRGDGWAIVVQGGFLLVLDSAVARRLAQM